MDKIEKANFNMEVNYVARESELNMTGSKENKGFVTLKSERIRWNLKLHEFANITKVSPHILRLAEDGHKVLTESEAKSLSLFLGHGEVIAEFLMHLIVEEG